MLDSILNSSTYPLLSALLLGLLTMISPCPFCSDVTAISFLSKNISQKQALFTNCLSYVLGKCFSYTLLALVFIMGGQIHAIRHFFEEYGEPALGPFLICVGIAIALFGWHESHHDHNLSHDSDEHKSGKHEQHEHSHEHAPHILISKLSSVNLKPLSGPVASFILGAVFALAFCPYSGLLYFGTLIPLTMLQPVSWSWLMPICFGLGDALPVIIIAILLSRGIAGIGKINGRLQVLETWLRRICVVLFIGMGLWLSISIFSGHHTHDHNGHHHNHNHAECIVH
ncbi:MAG: sulfite exporter TauE/SafE family protein [Paludibacteraceae bacterium]|nr:sulfite exporter TauE/SafE family protein [Paludibacteraceae bacterium]